MLIPTVARGLSVIQSSPAALFVRGGATASPAWVTFCANAAPIASMFIFFAVSVDIGGTQTSERERIDILTKERNLGCTCSPIQPLTKSSKTRMLDRSLYYHILL